MILRLLPLTKESLAADPVLAAVIVQLAFCKVSYKDSISEAK